MRQNDENHYRAGAGRALARHLQFLYTAAMVGELEFQSLMPLHINCKDNKQVGAEDSSPSSSILTDLKR